MHPVMICPQCETVMVRRGSQWLCPACGLTVG
jgi:ribosomal protein L37AE/L43A